MKFGAHVSIAGGVTNAPLKAHNISAETFQIFSRPPRGGKPNISPKQAKDFRLLCKQYNFTNYYIHAPYYINLASGNNKIYFGSIGALVEELKVAEVLDVSFVITHIGSAKDLGKKESIKKVVQAIKKISQKITPKKLLLELSAGQGNIIGDSFEELAQILEKSGKGNLGGICFDTCHAFVSGYDLRTKEKVDETLKKLDKVLGLNQLKVIHLNDSKFDFASKKDRHESIGNGKIGIEGFKAILADARLKDFDFILETPKESDLDDIKNLEILKKIRLEIYSDKKI
jgi:deoxyribonuclease-4